MPKQILNIDQFHGGLNSNSDPRDIADNELSAATDIMIDELGKIRTLGGTSAHDSSANVAAISAGYGLFQFSHDRTGGAGDGVATVDTLSTSYSDHTPGEYLNVALTGGTGNGVQATVVVAGNGRILVMPTITNAGVGGYVVNDELTILSSVVGGGGNETVNVATLEFGLETGDDYLAMADTDDAANIDIYSSALDAWGAGIIGLGSTTGMKPTFYNVDGALRVSDGNFNNTNKWYGYIKRTHFDGTSPGGSADDYDGWYSKDQEISAPTRGVFGEYVQGTGHTDSTDTVLKSTNSTAFSGMNTQLDLGDYIAVNHNDDQARIISTADDDDELTTIALSGENWDDDTYSIYPSDGTGFNVLVAPTSGGSWDANDYEIASTFIYDGGQESLPFSMGGDGDIFAVTANQRILIKVYCTSPFDPRITGGRIYIRKYDTSDPWTLFVDISLKDGIRFGLGEDYDGWSLRTATGSGDAGTTVYLTNSGTIYSNDQNAETYEVLSGISQEENTLIAKFKTAVVANRMVYVGNISMINEDNETVVMGDAMIKSPVNKFDILPLSRIVEASVQDGDEIVKLEEYADRLLQFKKNKMHLINISQEIEFLEDTFMHKGVSHPAATCKTDFGIAWVNKLGCYLYDGQKVSNLLEKKGRQIIKESDWATFTANEPMIGYIPKKRQLLVVDDNTSTGTGNIFLYDMVTQSWIEGGDATFTSADLTNFVTDWNGDLVHAHTSDTGTVVKWDDTSDTSGNLSVITKDIDFGQPGVRKKIYRVYVTYKSGATTNVQVDYDVDGGTTFPYDFADGTNFTTTELDNASGWQVAELKPDVSSEANNIKSFRLRFATDGTVPAGFEINDISAVYRLKHVR